MRRIVVRGELRVVRLFTYSWADKKNVAMTAREALAFIRKHGVVLESARGPVPSLAQVIAGEPVRGSWWSHPKSREIFAVTRAVRDSDDVLVCRLIDGKITFVHRRLWPALVRVADRLPSVRLSQLREVHTRSGRHVTTEVTVPRLGSVERPGRSSKSLGGRGARSVRLDRIKEEPGPTPARRCGSHPRVRRRWAVKRLAS